MRTQFALLVLTTHINFEAKTKEQSSCSNKLFSYIDVISSRRHFMLILLPVRKWTYKLSGLSNSISKDFFKFLFEQLLFFLRNFERSTRVHSEICH